MIYSILYYYLHPVVVSATNHYEVYSVSLFVTFQLRFLLSKADFRIKTMQQITKLIHQQYSKHFYFSSRSFFVLLLIPANVS